MSSAHCCRSGLSLSNRCTCTDTAWPSHRLGSVQKALNSRWTGSSPSSTPGFACDACSRAVEWHGPMGLSLSNGMAQWVSASAIIDCQSERTPTKGHDHYHHQTHSLTHCTPRPLPSPNSLTHSLHTTTTTITKLTHSLTAHHDHYHHHTH